MKIKMKNGTAIEGEAVLEIETKLGTLFVDPVTEPGYPGFYICLRRPDGRAFVPMLVEVDQCGWEDEPVMKMHYWSPEHHFDDPVWDTALTAAEIDSTWKKEDAE